MSKLRSVSTSMWSDSWFEELSVESKLLFIYLITNEKTNMLGIYEVSIKKISFETGLEKESVLKALEGFKRDNKIDYIDNYVILINFLKHQSFNTNMKKSAIDVYNELPKSLKLKELKVSKSNPLKSFESLKKGYGMVRKVEDELEVEYEEEIEVEEEEEIEEEIGKQLYSFGDWKNIIKSDEVFIKNLFQDLRGKFTYLDLQTLHNDLGQKLTNYQFYQNKYKFKLNDEKHLKNSFKKFALVYWNHNSTQIMNLK